MKAHLKPLRLCFELWLPHSLLGDVSQTLLNKSAIVGLANHREIDPHDFSEEKVDSPRGDVGSDDPGKSSSSGLSAVFVHASPVLDLEATEGWDHVEVGFLA